MSTDRPLRTRARWAAGRYRAAWQRGTAGRRRLRAVCLAMLIVAALLVVAVYGSLYGFLGAVLVLLGIGAVRWSLRDGHRA